MRSIIICLLFSVLLVLSLGKPADKKKEVKGRYYSQRPNGNGTVSSNGRWQGGQWANGPGGYFYARPHPGGGWWVTPARPRPNGK